MLGHGTRPPHALNRSLRQLSGRYAIVGDSVRFTPDPSEETRGLRMLAGAVVNTREIRVPFHYRNGTRERDRTLVMRRNDNIF